MQAHEEQQIQLKKKLKKQPASGLMCVNSAKYLPGVFCLFIYLFYLFIFSHVTPE